ncbi:MULTISPECIES: SGNH/GDSL hydrolase family protein [Francisella]|uniref:SGNH/GDSL hydrolase family protein n=1 Tax=Francisella marina TaxID=2249302 RepID=A0ABX5ZIC5_9GAMM|nr:MULTISPECIES: SGNH/GDSL hydrolase family protein [Francisella]QEO57776.1 SGNH/GDSL hydrolase family protein [Francisella marina]QEO59998.1 SGNH/GDSL hydrolase family protein [Francisella marina]
MRKLSLVFLTLTTSLTELCYADARSQIIIENNCSVPISFSISPGNSTGNAINNQVLDTNQYINVGQYTNDKFVDYNSAIDINFHSENLQYNGSIQYNLKNGWTINSANFDNLNGDIAIEHQNNDFDYSWHSYTTTLKYRIPIFTISACPKFTSPQNSKLKDIERILIFGDSLSDTGNLYGYTNGIIPRSTPYYRGMFSNGSVWTTMLSGTLENKIPISNYAVGGATAVFEPSWTDLGLPYTIGTELQAYSLDDGAHDTNKNLAIFFIGANDYLTISANQDPSLLKNIASEVTDKIIAAIKTVNAQKTLVIGLPNLGLTPESKNIGNQNLLKEVSSLHNQILKQFAENQTNIDFVDMNPIFEMLVNDTDNFNKKYHTSINPNKTNQSCWSGGYFSYNPDGQNPKDFYENLLRSNSKPVLLQESENISSGELDMSKIPLTPDITSAILAAETGKLCDNPQEYIFWDGVHPTYQVHKALFEYIANEYLGINI